MFIFLLVVHIIVAALLVVVILMQKSEGGGLASSGNPAGLMSARGAADFLTRATAILGTLFVILSITLAALATVQNGSTKIDTSLVGKTATTPAEPAPAPNDPLAAAAAQGGGEATTPANAATAAPAAPANGAAPK